MRPPHPGGQPPRDGPPLQQLQRAVPEQLGRSGRCTVNLSDLVTLMITQAVFLSVPYHTAIVSVCVSVCTVYICVSLSQWRHSRCSLGNYTGEGYSSALPSSQARTDLCSMFPEELQTYTLNSLLSSSSSSALTYTHTHTHMHKCTHLHNESQAGIKGMGGS